ncbi:MAG: ECF transporter S component [Candidatus Hodarchaeales archaeon]
MTRESNPVSSRFSWLSLFSTEDLITIALLAALGLGTKQVVGPVLKAIVAVFLIPGGAIAGAFYMMWLVLSRNAVDKPFSATLTGLVQGITILFLPYGSHGIMSLITYTAPGLSIDIVFYSIALLIRVTRWNITALTENEYLNGIYGGTANLTGTFLTAEVFDMFNGLDLIFPALYLLLAFASGFFGGLLAHVIFIEWLRVKGERTNQIAMTTEGADQP